MKTDRKSNTDQSSSKTRAAKGTRRTRANGKHPLVPYEHASIGIVEASLEGKYINANEEFCRITGYEKKELLRKQIRDLTHEDDYAIDLRLHESLVAGSIPYYKLEKRYVRKDGTDIWVELTRSVVRAEDGKPLHTVGVVLDISDRKHVERVLRESAERLRLATEAAQMFTWEWNFKEQTYTLADSFEKVLGFSGGLLPQNHVETVSRLVSVEDVQRIVEAYQNALESVGDLHALVFRVIDPESRRTVWLELSAKIVYDEQKKPVRMFGVAQNITQSKQAQDEMAIISRFPGEDPNPVMRLTPDGKILYGNDASAPLRDAWMQLEDRQIPDVLQGAVTQAFSSGHKTEVELRHEDRVFSCTLAPIRDAGYVNLYGKDVTERKQMEIAIRESEERFRALVSQATAGIAQSDLDSVLVFVNPRFCEMLGYSEEELLGKKIWDLTYADDLEENKRLYQRMLNESASYQFEKRFIRKDGSHLWTNVTVSTIRDLEGKSKGGVGVIIDIEERKRAEAALTEYAREQGALYRLVDQLHGTVSFEDIFNAALDAIVEALQCERASILLFEDSDVMRFVAWRGLSEAYRTATDGHSPWSPDAIKPEPIAMDDVATADLSDSLRATIQGEGIGSLAFIPLVSNDRLIGKFMIYFNAPHGFTDSELDLSLTIARQLAFGIDRKRAEEKLRESNERFMRFVDSNIVGILIGDASGRIILANDYYLDLLGVSRQDFMEGNVDWKKFTPSEWLPADEKAVRELRASGVCEPYEKEYIRTDGTRVPVYIANALLPGPGEEIAAFVLDITERKRAEETLRRNEELFSTLIQTAPFGVYFIDSEFRLRAVNAGSEEVFRGIQPLIGRDFAEILRILWKEPFATEAIERFRHTLRTGESFISPPIIELRANLDEIQSYDWQIHRITMPDGTFGVVCYFYDLSEQKRMEASVRASEALYRAIASNIPGGSVYVVDKDFRYLVAEGSVTEAFGLSRQMIEGHTVMEVFPDERGEQMEEHLRRCFAGETISFETQFSGRTYWTHIAPLHGSIGQAILLTLDITERKQVEEALRQSEERFALFMQHLPGLAWIKDIQGQYVYANAAAERAFRTPREQLYGKTDHAIFPEDVAAQFKRNDERSLADGQGVQVVEMLRHDDGILHYSLVSKFPIPGPDGNPTLIGGTAFDITERLRAEEALRESEERLRAILRQATAGIVRKDAEGRLIFVNQAFCNMLGYTEAELLGKTMWDFMHPDDIEENRLSYHRLMTEGIPFKLERRLICQDGSMIWVDASVSPIMDVEGRPQSAVAVEVDVTGRKQAEEALQQLNLQLEERVMSRTARLRTVNQTLREEIAERQRVEDALRRSEALAQENEAKLRSLFELLPVGISFLDLQGQVLQTNAALLRILHLSKDEFRSKNYQSRKYIRANGTPMLPAEFASARALAEDRTIYNVETGIVLENNTVVWTSVSAAPVNVADVGVVVVTVDITEKKRAEQALHESHARLRILSQRLVEVQEEERRALARELHDRVGQTLAALNINLIIINSQLPPDVGEQIGTRLNDSMKLVAETIALVRDVMTDLRPAVLDDYGLEAALESHLSQYTARYGINVKLERTNQPIPRLGSSVEMTFLRIAQEALMNIARHAQATQVNLSLRRERNEICMTIQDNGVGIQSWQEANRPGSHGLTIMRERAEAFGGSLQVRSIPGQGTRIEASIPVRGQDNALQEKNV